MYSQNLSATSNTRPGLRVKRMSIFTILITILCNRMIKTMTAYNHCGRSIKTLRLFFPSDIWRRTLKTYEFNWRISATISYLRLLRVYYDS